MLQVLGPVAGFGIEQDETGVYLVLRLGGSVGDGYRGVARSIEGRGQVVAHQAGVATFARLRPAHSLRIAQSAVPATYHNPDCAEPRTRARGARPGTKRSAGVAGAELRPRSGRTNTMPCGFGTGAVCDAPVARNLRTARSCPAEGRPKGSAPQGLTGKKKMWKGSGWALDQP